MCSGCSALYHDHEHGRRWAEECCMCSTCGEHPAMRTGRGSQCDKCEARDELDAAEEAVLNAQSRLREAKRLFKANP